MIERDRLEKLYQVDGLSSAIIARRLKCSTSTVDYWLSKHRIPKRSISDAIYKKWNPKGNPFQERVPHTIEEAILYGIGIGLYWGEGTKANKHSVRLGNSNPALVKKFIEFLSVCYGIKKDRLRFGLQIFGDMDKEIVIKFWTRYLGIARSQLYPGIVITPHRGVGNYRKKTAHGVMTVYFNNKKLRDILCNTIEEMV